jgi:hypothetical protein
MAKKYSAVAVQGLKEALCSIYWYKSDLKSFLRHALSNQTILGKADWDSYKRQIVSDIVDALLADETRNADDLERLFREVCKFQSFRHLEQLEDGAKKARIAKESVEALRKLVTTHEQVLDDEKQIEERRKKAAQKLAQSTAVIAKLQELKERFMGMLTQSDAQKRGFELERLMYDLFQLFDLDPKASFRNLGEQIDGAFHLEATDFLFEGKWQKEPIGTQDLDGFAAKVNRKLDNTLGLFFSLNGFSPTAVAAHSTGRPVVLLMTGEDLMAVLEGRIDFVSLLLRKRRHAALTGQILLPIHEIFQS